MADIYADVHKGNHYLIGIAISNLGSAYMAEKQNAEAERLFREALAMYGKTLPPDHLYAAVARIKLGRTLVRQKRYREGEKDSLAGYEVLKKGASPAVSWLQSARMDLAESYAALGDAEKARAFRAEYESVKESQ